MRRKLVKQGSATYTVSLPKEWIDRFNLKSGEEIDLEESGMQLIISTIQKQGKYETIKYDFSKIPSSLVHEFVVSLYKSGQKDIAIEQIEPEKLKLTREIVDSTIGFQILGLEKNKAHIVDLGISDEESIIKAEQQIYWRLLHMIDQVINKNSKEKEIYEIDLEINKLSFFIQRNLATKFSSNSKNFMTYEKAAVLESIGDFLRSFKIYSKMSEEDIHYLKLIAEILDLLRAQRADISYYKDIKDKLTYLRNLAEKSKKKGDNNSALASVLLYKNIKQLFDICFTLNIESFSEK